MSADASLDHVARIGETAGDVWRYLNENGPVSVTGLAQKLDVPRDQVMQAVGWLAREDKIIITEAGRTKTIALNSN